MMPNKKYIGIIGSSEELCTPDIYDFAYQLGNRLAETQHVFVNGGKKGIMEAVFKGVKSAKNYFYGQTVGIIPEEDKNEANKYVDIVIATGIGSARNKILINTADIIIAIAGGSGTLSEIAFVLQMKKALIAYTGFEGWAKKLSGMSAEERNEKFIYLADNIDEILQLINKL